MLVGILHRPVARCDVAVLIIVGGPQYRIGSHRQFVLIARSVAAEGCSVLRFDMRGMGDSEGEFVGFEHVAEDIRAAIDALCESCRPKRGVVVLGLCDAASAALMYCMSDSRVQGLILMNPWVRTGQSHSSAIVKHYYAARLLHIAFWVKLFSGSLRIVSSLRAALGHLTRAFMHKDGEVRSSFITAMRIGLQEFRGPVLLVLSGRDLTADEFRSLCSSNPEWDQALAQDSVKVVSARDADHTFSKAADLAELNEHCANWLKRHFGH